jgi:hypothetical protein
MDATTAWLVDPAEPGVRAQALIHLEGRSPDDPVVTTAQRESLVRGSIARILDGLVVPSEPSGLWMPKYGAPFNRLIDPRRDGRYKPIYAKVMAETVRLEVEPHGPPSRWATLAAMRVLQSVGITGAR